MRKAHSSTNKQLSDFLSGKSEHTAMLFHHFIEQFKTVGEISVIPANTMIGIANSHRRVAYVTQLGKNFVHVVFPFKKAHKDNFCFQKIAEVPGNDKQFNHHFRMLFKEDVNKEVLGFMKLAFKSEEK